jgi:ankyrin repeat domain-containing protein 50
MHQTVREFFLNGNGHVANSKFRMYARDAHICVSITCIRYLMLYTANTTMVGRPPDIESWSSEHVKGYAQYLDKMPLVNYALCHLKHHINGSQQDVYIRGIFNQFIDKLTCKPNVNLLESWVSSHWNKNLLSNKQAAAAQDFRHKVLLTTARNGLSSAAEVSLTARVNANWKSSEGWTALHFAGREGHEAVVRLLVMEGKMDVNVKDKYRWTALHLAADKGHEAVVRLLVMEGKADVNLRIDDYDGRTALHLAADKGHEAVVRLLVIEGKADVNLCSSWYDVKTALHLAADKGHEAVVRLLVMEGKADVNLRSNRNGARTALHLAADKGHEAVVRLLVVEGKADVNLRINGYDRRTALHLAADKGHEAVIRLLVMEGKARMLMRRAGTDGQRCT